MDTTILPCKDLVIVETTGPSIPFSSKALFISFRIRNGEKDRSVGTRPAYWPFWTSTSLWSVFRAGFGGLLVGFLGATVCQSGWFVGCGSGSSRDPSTIVQSVFRSRDWSIGCFAILAKVCFLALLVLVLELAVLVVLVVNLVVLALVFASWSVFWAIFRVVFSRLAT